MKLVILFVGTLILLLFCYFRLKPIFFQTVPYTYDQGRDFLQAQEIMRDKHFTLLGPTTGIPGIYHGVWWYYFLAIPYFFSRGNPLGFLLFLFLVALVQTILFSWFLKREFGVIPALMFATLVAISPYFIGMSFFAISSVQNLPVLLFLFYATHQFLKKKAPLFLFLIFLALGFSFESEVPFGLFLIPSYISTIFLTRQFKLFFNSPKKVAFAVCGLIIPMVPRILFELRHSFLQTKAVLAYLSKPVFYNPHSFQSIFSERTTVFLHYYLVLFPDSNLVLAWLTLLITLFGLIYGYKKLNQHPRLYLNFLGSLFVSMFLLSLFYKDTFWANYFEGLSYYYIIFIALASSMLILERKKTLAALPWLLLCLLLLVGVFNLVQNIRTSAPKKIEGMREQLTVVKKIYNQEKNNSFCVRIYTPPVIPYTYRYIFDYYAASHHFQLPQDTFVKGRCWYIIERDEYAFRVDDWRKQNIPRNSTLIQKEGISDNVRIELWEKP